MIGRLRGELLEVEGNLAIIDCGGVGYEVTIPESVLLQLAAPGEQVNIFTRQIFREDGVSLYGFLLPFQRRVFDLLISVKGCGPKVALSLLGQVGEDSILSGILSQDSKILARASGVGPKLAERIVLELRDKMNEEALLRRIEAALPASSGPVKGGDELVEALMALGYSRREAEHAAGPARDSADGVHEQLKVALRSLQR
jgi:Holliday junction DNA helicase RuvA